MSPVFLLHAKGRIIVTANFRNAMRQAAAVLCLETHQDRRSKRADGFPALADIGAAGHFHQWLRFANATGPRQPFEIEEHEVGAHPGTPSLLRRFDMVDGADPSYEVQSALWKLLLRNDEATGDLAGAIRARIEEDVAEKRSAGIDDVRILDDYRVIELQMGGLAVVPSEGQETAILDHLGETAARRFVEIAEML